MSIEKRELRIRIHTNRISVFIFLLLTSHFSLLTSCFSDIIYLNEGEEISGTLKEIKKEIVYFETDEKRYLKWDIEQIERIELEETEESWREKDFILDSLIKFAPDTLKYPDVPYVTLLEEVIYRIENPKSEIRNPKYRWTVTRRVIQKVLREKGKYIANRQFPYLTSDETLKIDFARAVGRNGEIIPLKERSIKDESIWARYPDYENLHRKKIALQGVERGGIIDIKTTKESTLPFLIDENFGDFEPIEKKVVKLIVPKEMEISVHKGKGIKTDNLQPRTENRIYIWTMENPDSIGIEKETDMPPLEDIVPRLVVGIKDSWENIGNKFYAMIEDSLNYSEDIREKLEQLISPRDIYNFVAKEIKFIDITPGGYSYSPKRLDKISQNRQGSRLDKAFLLYGILKYKGFKPSIVLVRPRDNGRVTPSVPSLREVCIVPLVMIDSIFLCPYYDTYSFGAIPSRFVTTLGLLIDEKDSRLIEIPLFSPERESKKSILKGNLLSDGSIEIKKSISLKGDIASQFRKNKDMKDKEFKNLMEEWVSKIHPNARLKKYKISDLSNLDKDVKVEIEYKIDDYCIKGGDFLVFSIPEIDYSAASVGKKERKHDLYFGKRLLEETEIEIEIPKDYKVYYIPESITCHSERSEKSKLATYNASFKRHKNKILFTDSFILKEREGKKADYKSYKECIEKRARITQERIVLKR